jgi:L-alanine-DL-glutamate epimerase-like enolase superfamily enzyme
MVDIFCKIERWPIAGGFTIARGSKTEAVVVVAEISAGSLKGRGESVPYARYGETAESVVTQINSISAELSATMSRNALAQLLPAGAARNALDCALWDIEAKKAGARAWDIAAISAPLPVETAYTISLADADTMFAKAQEAAHRPLLKIKLGTPDDLPRLEAVHAGAPGARIIVDANEGWRLADLEKLLPKLEENGVVLIEQPLAAGQDGELAHLQTPVPLCADESAHTSQDIRHLTGLYQAVNIKLDKTGGLTEALKMAAAAQEAGMEIMIGCMVGTSLAMAPALLLTGSVRYVDLDGPLLLAKDRPEGLMYVGSLVHPPSKNLWG